MTNPLSPSDIEEIKADMTERAAWFARHRNEPAQVWEYEAWAARYFDKAPRLLAHVSKQDEAIKALEERNKGLEKEIADLELDILRLPAIALDSARAQAIAETREECAKIAEKSAHDHKNGARDAYRKASKLHDLGMMDDADQRTISAQALDCIADEAAAIAAAIRASFPASPSLEPEQS